MLALSGVYKNGQVLLQEKVEFTQQVKVIVTFLEETTENFEDFLTAAQSSLDFWDNSFDDEDWNHV
jgi:hypothetical protein